MKPEYRSFTLALAIVIFAGIAAVVLQKIPNKIPQEQKLNIPLNSGANDVSFKDIGGVSKPDKIIGNASVSLNPIHGICNTADVNGVCQPSEGEVNLSLDSTVDFQSTVEEMMRLGATPPKFLDLVESIKPSGEVHGPMTEDEWLAQIAIGGDLHYKRRANPESNPIPNDELLKLLKIGRNIIKRPVPKIKKITTDPDVYKKD